MQTGPRFGKIRTILRAFGSLLGGGFLLYQIFYTVKNFHWSPVFHSMLPAAMLALFFTALATIFQMGAWKVLLGNMGVHLPLESVFAGFSLSFVARYIPGTIWGYLARGEWLKRDFQVPYTVSNLGSIIETFGNITAVFIAVILGLLAKVNLLLSIFLLISIAAGCWAAMNFFLLLKPFQRLFQVQGNGISRLSFFQWLIIVGLHLGMWFCYGLALSIFAGAIDPNIDFNQVSLVNGIYALAWFIGFIVLFLPLGIGLREYSLSMLFIAYFGLAEPNASLISLGFRLFVSLGELIWVLFGLIKKLQSPSNRLEI